MTPKALLTVALLLAAGPAAAYTIPWGKTVDANTWSEAAFRDVNGQAVVLHVYPPAFDEAKNGDDVPLYTWTKVSEQDGVITWQARLSAYRGTASIPTGEEGSLAVILPGVDIRLANSKFKERWTAPFKWSLTGLDGYNKAAPDALAVAPKITLPDFGGSSANANPGRIIVLYPDGREPDPPVIFPELARAIVTEPSNIGSIKPAEANEAAPMRVFRRFIAFEFGLGQITKELQSPFAMVKWDEMSGGPAYKAANEGDNDALDAFAQKRRGEILAKAKDQYDDFVAGRTSRQTQFNKVESELLWTIVGLSGGRATFSQQAVAALPADKRQAFVGRYRDLLVAELNRYRDAATPLTKQQGMLSSDVFNKYIEGLKDRVKKTIDGDAAQLTANGTSTSPAVISKKVNAPSGSGAKKGETDGVIGDMFK